MSYEEIEFSRHCDAIQIPQGIKVTIPKGTPGVITQALGDTYTLQLANARRSLPRLRHGRGRYWKRK